MRVKRGGRVADDLDFQILFSQIWRRLTMLSALYGSYGAEDDETFRRLREAAHAVRTVDRRLRTLRWEHLSTATGERKPMQGLLGHMTFEGDLGPFLPVLTAGEAVHVGGCTSFGLGRMRVTAHRARGKALLGAGARNEDQEGIVIQIRRASKKKGQPVRYRLTLGGRLLDSDARPHGAAQHGETHRKYAARRNCVRRPGMSVTIAMSLRLLSPAFLGGAGPEAELRPPTLKGLLRFWHRAMDPRFRERERRIFGGAGEGAGQSQVLLRVEAEPFAPWCWDKARAQRFTEGGGPGS